MSGHDNRIFSEPCHVLTWYRSSVVAVAGVELADDALAPKSGSASLAAEAALAHAGDTPPESGQSDAAATDGEAPVALAELADASERARAYAGRSKSEATIRAYAAGWRDFLRFCEQRGVSALPASDQTVAAYLASLADRQAKAATIARRLVVIS
jgi:hypothetical protein